MPSEPAPSTANPFTRSIEAQHFPVISPLHNRSRGAGSMAGLGSKKLYPKRLRQNTSSVSVSRSWQAGAGGRCRRNKFFSTRSSQIVTCSAHLSLSQPLWPARSWTSARRVRTHLTTKMPGHGAKVFSMPDSQIAAQRCTASVQIKPALNKLHVQLRRLRLLRNQIRVVATLQGQKKTALRLRDADLLHPTS